MQSFTKKFVTLTLFASMLQITTMTFAVETSKPNHGMIFTPKTIKWEKGPDSLPKGVEFAVLEGNPSKEGPFTIRLKMPANYQIPSHWHPGIEHITVISGAIYVGMSDKFDQKQAKELPTGGFTYMQPEMHHFAFTRHPTIIQLHGMGPWGITYIDSKDDPRKTH